MQTREMKVQIIHKHKLEVEWLETDYIPAQGELVIYDTEIGEDGTTLSIPNYRNFPYNYERVKIGDGFTGVNHLPFTMNIYVQSTIPTGAGIGSIWIDTSEVSTLQAEEVAF